MKLRIGVPADAKGVESTDAGMAGIRLVRGARQAPFAVALAAAQAPVRSAPKSEGNPTFTHFEAANAEPALVPLMAGVQGRRSDDAPVTVGLARTGSNEVASSDKVPLVLEQPASPIVAELTDARETPAGRAIRSVDAQPTRAAPQPPAFIVASSPRAPTVALAVDQPEAQPRPDAFEPLPSQVKPSAEPPSRPQSMRPPLGAPPQEERPTRTTTEPRSTPFPAPPPLELVVPAPAEAASRPGTEGRPIPSRVDTSSLAPVAVPTRPRSNASVEVSPEPASQAPRLVTPGTDREARPTLTLVSPQPRTVEPLRRTTAEESTPTKTEFMGPQPTASPLQPTRLVPPAVMTATPARETLEIAPKAAPRPGPQVSDAPTRFVAMRPESAPAPALSFTATLRNERFGVVPEVMVPPEQGLPVGAALEPRRERPSGARLPRPTIVDRTVAETTGAPEMTVAPRVAPKPTEPTVTPIPSTSSQSPEVIDAELTPLPERRRPLSMTASADDAPLPRAARATELAPGMLPSVVPPTPVLPAAKASMSSPVTEDIGTKSAELKARRDAIEQPAPIALATAPQTTPLILELAAQRLAPPPVELRRPRAESQVMAPAEAVGGIERKRELDRPELGDATGSLKPALPTAPADAPPRLEAVSAPPPVPNLAPPMLEDPSLRVVVLPNLARVNVETADQGSLSLQVRVQDGVTDIRATGPAAPMVEARQSELRVALANEGLSLGRFEFGQSDSNNRRERFETPDDRDTLPRRAPARATTSQTLRADGRLSVKA